LLSFLILFFYLLNVLKQVLKKRLCSKGFFVINIINDDPYHAFEEIQKFSTSSGNILVFCDIDILIPSKPYPLVYQRERGREKGRGGERKGEGEGEREKYGFFVIFSYLIYLFQVGIPNVVTVLMGYLRTKTFDDEFGKLEFLRKPIKESTLVACLREVWSIFETNLNSSSKRPLEMNANSNSSSISNSKPRLLSKPILRAPSSPKVTPQPVYPLNILVVEGFLIYIYILYTNCLLDNEINQKVVRRVFQHLGYSLSMANNGMDALAKIEQNGMPDMILMDVQMYV
jgi:hypothetical protein